MKNELNQATGSMFRAGDIVKHNPTGEEWVLAVDQEDDRVMPNGWPETLAYASDCEIVKRSTDSERREYIETWATKNTGDYRTLKAKRQLSALNAKL